MLSQAVVQLKVLILVLQLARTLLAQGASGVLLATIGLTLERLASVSTLTTSHGSPSAKHASNEGQDTTTSTPSTRSASTASTSHLQFDAVVMYLTNLSQDLIRILQLVSLLR